MFESLSERLNSAFKTLSGKGKLTDENMKVTLKEIRNALLEADVALPVVKAVLNKIKEEAKGTKVRASLSPAQELVKVVNDKLIEIMGDSNVGLNLAQQPPAVILMAGLQGSGKTTTVAKLANLLQSKQKKKVLVASCDLYRPAAVDQLKTLATEISANFWAPDNLPQANQENIVNLAKDAISQAKKQFMDVVIIDTAGRLHIDETMMAEIKALHSAINPVETLFVVDGMTGQDAARTAKAFDDALALTGVIVTKLDGDTRGGAILSIKEITNGKPIKFIGIGEKIDALDVFHPERMASRILGMGDVLSLIEDLEANVDKKAAEKLAKKVEAGKSFNLEDFKEQLIQMHNMGGMGSLMDKMPGMGALPQALKSQVNDKVTHRMLAMINSMTKYERRRPASIVGSRKRRIAEGSGVTIQDVNQLLKQFNQMQKMMGKLMKKGGMAKMMQKMQGLQSMMGQGGMPGGWPKG